MSAVSRTRFLPVWFNLESLRARARIPRLKDGVFGEFEGEGKDSTLKRWCVLSFMVYELINKHHCTHYDKGEYRH